MSWTTEKQEKLKKLWKQGLTASQIATELADTTRNAVIGKAHRLNLESRGPSKKSTLKSGEEIKGSASIVAHDKEENDRELESWQEKSQLLFNNTTRLSIMENGNKTTQLFR